MLAQRGVKLREFLSNVTLKKSSKGDSTFIAHF